MTSAGNYRHCAEQVGERPEPSAGEQPDLVHHQPAVLDLVECTDEVAAPQPGHPVDHRGARVRHQIEPAVDGPNRTFAILDRHRQIDVVPRVTCHRNRDALSHQQGVEFGFGTASCGCDQLGLGEAESDSPMHPTHCCSCVHGSIIGAVCDRSVKET